jgi:hypothetical protein
LCVSPVGHREKQKQLSDITLTAFSLSRAKQAQLGCSNSSCPECD